MIHQVFWKEKKIPTWLGLFVLIVGLGVGVYFVQRPQFTTSQAAPEQAPQQVEITNITDKSFTVSWVTKEPATGLLNYGENSRTNFVARDTRDTLTGEIEEFNTHWITVSGLKPTSTYAFKIFSAGEEYDNNGSPYTVNTATSTSSDQAQSTVSEFRGSVIDPLGNPASGSIVFLRAENLSTLSTLVNLSGEWSIRLTTARTSDLNQLFLFENPQQKLELFIHGGNFPNSTVVFSSQNEQPLPEVTLGQDYDIRTFVDPNSSIPQTPKLSEVFTAVGATEPPPGEGVVIWSPEAGATFYTTRPLIVGSAPPRVNINLIIDDELDRTVNLQADNRGYWQWIPSVPLSEGLHNVSASYSTQQQTYEESREFTIETSSEQPINILPSATPIPTATPTETLNPIISPTGVLEIMPTVTPTPTDVDIETTITSTPTATPTPAIPVAGVSMPTVGLFGFGLILLGLGVMLVL